MESARVTGAFDAHMKDVDHDADEETAYECFRCGSIVTGQDHPMDCPDCGGAMRHRRTPLE